MMRRRRRRRRRSGNAGRLSVILPITAVARGTRRPSGWPCDENPLGGFWPR
jgi:hypothetical protein